MGKVFFSINVDAAEARAWEDTRGRAEAVVRAIPGVTTVMVALTAERQARSRICTATFSWRETGFAAPPARCPGGLADGQAGCDPRSGRHHCGRLRQRAVSASQPQHSISRSACVISASRSGCSTPTFYGPSVPRLTGVRKSAQLNDAKKMVPSRALAYR